MLFLSLITNCFYATWLYHHVDCGITERICLGQNIAKNRHKDEIFVWLDHDNIRLRISNLQSQNKLVGFKFIKFRELLFRPLASQNTSIMWPICDKLLHALNLDVCTRRITIKIVYNAISLLRRFLSCQLFVFFLQVVNFRIKSGFLVMVCIARVFRVVALIHTKLNLLFFRWKQIYWSF